MQDFFLRNTNILRLILPRYLVVTAGISSLIFVFFLFIILELHLFNYLSGISDDTLFLLSFFLLVLFFSLYCVIMKHLDKYGVFKSSDYEIIRDGIILMPIALMLPLVIQYNHFPQESYWPFFQKFYLLVIIFLTIFIICFNYIVKSEFFTEILQNEKFFSVKRVTKNPWFKSYWDIRFDSFKWGYIKPVSWQGWLITICCSIPTLFALMLWIDLNLFTVIFVIDIVTLYTVAVLTGLLDVSNIHIENDLS